MTGNQYNLRIGKPEQIAGSEVNLTPKSKVKKQINDLSNAPPNVVQRPTITVSDHKVIDDTLPKNRFRAEDKFKDEIKDQFSEIPGREAYVHDSQPSLRIDE